MSRNLADFASLRAMSNPAYRAAVSTALANGHDLTVDGVHAHRLTCLRRSCGRALLMPDGVVYGSAIDALCEDNPEATQ